MSNKNPYRKISEGVQIDRSDKRYKKFAKQRRNRGWDDTSLWNLDRSLAVLILPRLERFKKVTMTYPGGRPQEWDAALDKMIDAFRIIASQEYFELDGVAGPVQDRIDEGLQLFAKWYQALWS